MTNNSKKIIGLKVRLLAAQRLQTILKGKNFIPFDANEINDGRDRALANRLVTTALRYYGHLNIILAQTLKKGMPKKSADFEASMRIGLVELLFMDEMAEHSSIFLAVEAIKNNKKSAHLSKLANGILRHVQRNKNEFNNLPLIDLFPDWAKNNWGKVYDKEALEGFGKALLKGAELDLTLKNVDEKQLKTLNAQRVIFDSVRIFERNCPIVELAGYESGNWWAQDVASSLPARLMRLKTNSRVLDMCAAPGGKTAQLIKQGYDVSALEIDEKRIERLKENLKRLNYSANILLADATTYENQEKFDGIFLDAPCSSTGTFRRHPEVLWQRRHEKSEFIIELQQKLINNAISLLKQGGILIYATCSLEKKESEKQADWILKTYSKMISSPIKPSELEGNNHLVDKNGWLRATPNMSVFNEKNIDGMDGFFAARFIKQ